LTADFEKIYRIVRSAQESAISSIKPGMTTGSIDKIARDISGTPDMDGLRPFAWTWSRTGGARASRPEKMRGLRLREGMALTVEPGIYLHDRGGIRIEDVCWSPRRAAIY